LIENAFGDRVYLVLLMYSIVHIFVLAQSPLSKFAQEALPILSDKRHYHEYLNLNNYDTESGGEEVTRSRQP